MKAKLSMVVVAMFLAAAGCKDKTSKPDKSGEVKANAAPEFWSGALEVPGMPMKVGIVLTAGADGTYSGTFDMPMRNVSGMPLQKIERKGNKLTFMVLPKDAPPSRAGLAELTVDGKTAKGLFIQGPAKLPMTLTKVATRDELPKPWTRPQTPKPPFPYESREVLYDNPSDRSKLGGTLTIPKGSGPFPAVLLITGSGAQDRDETIFGHKPFAVIADYLSRRGFAVLRVDDRGVGKTTGSPAEATIQTHATDVEAGLAFLAKQKEIDAKRLGLIGHSEGGIIAPIVASRSKMVAFIVSLAGTGLSGAQISPMQLEAIMRGGAEKLTDLQIKTLVGHQAALMQLIVKDADNAALAKQLLVSYAALKKMAIKGAPQASMTQAQLEQTSKTEAAKVGGAWFRSFVKTDPQTYWKKVKVPVLALNGEKDTQVPPKQNLAAIGAALKAGGNKDYRLQELPSLNHLFQRAKTGLLAEYGELTETFNEGALELISNWLTEKTKR